jgi:prepilin-type N-terminal cleavage/methylation domain-containing protein/prepilin-type processing-associated H-X9-DG protein
MVARKHAFTLVELLLVVGIIAILIGLLLPSLCRARRASQIVSCCNNLRQLGMAFTLYAMAHRDVYPAAQDPVIAAPYKTLWMGMGFRPLLDPFISRSPGNPGVFLCSADQRSVNDGTYVSYAYSMCFYRSPDEIDSAYTDYKEQYWPIAPATALRAPVAQKLVSVRFPSQKILAGEFYCVHDTVAGEVYSVTGTVSAENGWWCWQGSRTFLFADGHAELLEASQILPGRDGFPNPNVTIHGIKGIDVR